MISFLIVFIFCFLTSVFFFSLGALSNKIIFKINKIDNVLEYCFLGLFSLSFIALLSNFLISLNIYFNSVIFIFSIFYLIFVEKKINLKFFYYSLIISLISLLTIVLDNTNRPDSGLYHLPYTSLINEHKLIIGVANLNERFGIISILQYLSAANYNFLFLDNGILIPLVIIYASTLIFFFVNIFNKKNSDIYRFLAFLFFIFILTNMNRYSGFGNDAPSHLFYFLLIFYFLKYDNSNSRNEGFKFIVIFTTYIFLIKTVFLIFFLVPIIYIFNNYKEIKIFNEATILSLFFFFIWIIKNLFITGCLIYPLNFTCFTNLNWTLNTNLVSLVGEAWVKGWPERLDKSLNYEQYLVNFNWISTWLNNHFKTIILKLVPFIIILFVLLTCFFNKSKNSNKGKLKKILLLVFLNCIFLMIWFFWFPNYRFGLGIIGSLISLIYILFLYNKIDFENPILYKFIIFFVIISSLAIFLKNSDRIYNNYKFKYVDFPWPKKNSHYLENEKLINLPIKKNNEILYYTTPSGELCFYSKSPCTHMKSIKIKKDKFLIFYEKYFIEK